MSNAEKPFVAQHSVPQGVVATRWWWVRHAPVRSDGGNIYGQKDMDCDCSDRVVFNAVSRILPRQAAWFASNLKRTHQTADAIWAAGFPKPDTMLQEPDLAEQHLGDWQGMNRAAFFASRPIAVGSYWFAPIDEPSPNGESFMDLYTRVRRAIERINISHAGQDIVAVAHGGTIKAAIGLALNDQPDRGLAFTIDNCSVTRLDHLASDGHAGWRIPMVNQQPWIADASHAAMHQPAGPEVVPTKLA
ncbi:histidine phosphatase family protein [Tardiphaga sp. vice352]|uniref:histidine phosphatase family protein n=1 Tax=unclassified Tardiphaga TaxID=2631404 RepID=UPI0011641C77|nr:MULTISPECIES: histidine phosphatase family protein [unclassified Tardiphaga]QDM17648.1 histidine phosphatase family protein [Tardiphaga sp. vice278]QDM22587.1 histidine phosphatase family protein [Tardiphaga sp. vice154]QDM27889.1 histidine phosphatase family protein [Tardiphaga sp. vice304]QDM33031.1 histidine phosphatase family protein [Tardiphaga sp. vice352]